MILKASWRVELLLGGGSQLASVIYKETTLLFTMENFAQ